MGGPSRLLMVGPGVSGWRSESVSVADGRPACRWLTVGPRVGGWRSVRLSVAVGGQLSL